MNVSVGSDVHVWGCSHARTLVTNVVTPQQFAINGVHSLVQIKSIFDFGPDSVLTSACTTLPKSKKEEESIVQRGGKNRVPA